ncbi:hypothetical protein M0804_010261 [Polistes exclamans]|nr:hypothetical protein M0804_010261 [Polistes exclamans]
MDLFTDGYYKLNRLLLLIMGQWPDQNYKIKLILMINTVSYLSFCLLGQFTKLLEDIQDLWNVTKTKEEIEIMEMYAKENRNYTLFLTAVSYFSLGFVNLLSLMPCILDIVLPLNVTRTRKFLYQAEFFLDTEKYFYPILLHTWITMFFGVTILVTTESIFLLFAQHCCSMYKIKILLGKLEVLLYLTLLGSIFCHGFLCAYPAQKVMDHSNFLFENAYNGFWYLAPVKAQKLLLLVIKRSIINTPIIFMKSIEISHQSFGVDTLKKMRQFDDKIIYKLNETIPTESFKGQVNLSSKCERLFEEVQNSHIQRESAINKCLIAAKERVKYLKNQKDSQGDDPIFIKNLRKEQTNLRLLQSELSVEEVLKNRTMNAFHDKCRGYYKPTNLSS